MGYFKREMTSEDFWNSVVAQDDDCDYSESGWVICVHENEAAMGRYSHCSCFGTFESLCGGGISDHYEKGYPSFDWTGTVEDLCDMANRIADPTIPERRATEEDYDFDHLVNCYSEFKVWRSQTKTD